MEHRDAELSFPDGLVDKSDRLNTVGKHEDPRRVAALGCAVVDLLEVLQELPWLLVLGANLYHLQREATHTNGSGLVTRATQQLQLDCFHTPRAPPLLPQSSLL